MLAVRRTLQQGLKAGLATGLGAALADTLFGMLALGGLQAVSEFLLSRKEAFQLGGGVFLCALGTYFLFKKPSARTAEAQAPRSFFSSFFSSFVLMLTNPITISAFVGVMAAFGTHPDALKFEDLLFLVFGILVGCVFWWTSLVLLVERVAKGINYSLLNYLNSGTALFLIICGVLTLLF